MNKLSACALGILLLSGCASVTSSTLQPITIKTVDMSGAPVQFALCELSSKDGEYFVYTPGTVTINKSSTDMKILCKKDGYPDGGTMAFSGGNGAVLGNIVAGGVVGALVDMGTGAAYEYPSSLKIIMGVVSRGIELKEGDKIVFPRDGYDVGAKILKVNYTVGQEPWYDAEVTICYQYGGVSYPPKLKAGDKISLYQSEVKRRMVE